jgi:hypothetical protein
MKRFAVGLSISTMMMISAAAFAQTDPNTPTGPNNPNPPAELTGQASSMMPCNPAANLASNSAPSPMAAAGQAAGAQGSQQTNGMNNKSPTAAGCATQDHPAGGSAPKPATAPHP